VHGKSQALRLRLLLLLLWDTHQNEVPAAVHCKLQPLLLLLLLLQAIHLIQH
jgi:hypothetical protein